MASSTVVYCFMFIIIHEISCTSDSSYNLNRQRRALLNSSAKCYANDASESWYSGANDVIVVKQSDGSLKATLLQLRVGKLTNFWTSLKSREGKRGRLFVNGKEVLVHAKIEFILGKSGELIIYDKISKSYSCILSNRELKQLELKEGRNVAQLVFDNLKHKQVFDIYLLDQQTKFVIADIDGTITKSDFQGLLAKIFEFDHHHDGVIELFDAVSKNGYVLIYVSAISSSADELTRKYLFDQLQNIDGHSLPRSPLFMSPITWHKALISQDKAAIKFSTLHSIIELFDRKEKVIAAAYGNKDTDTKAYLDSGINPNKVFLVREDGHMIDIGTETKTSYVEHFQNVSSMFPKY